MSAGILLVAAVFGLTAGGFSTAPAHADKPDSSTASAPANLQTLNLTRPPKSPNAPATGGAISFVGEATVVAPNSPAGSVEVDLNGARSNDKQASIYVVREGDTIGEVAEMFGVSVNTIIWANDIEGKSISPEEVLVILPMSGVRHEVEEGDTVSSLADTYDSSEEEIREYNELDGGDELSVGAIVDIPGGEKPKQVAVEPDPKTTVSRGAVTPTQAAPASAGYFINPLPGSMVTQGLHGYNAVDFSTGGGGSVVASASGRVVKSVGAGYNGGYGKFVTIQHANGMTTLYSHLSSVIVSRGQQVVQGQVLGYEGNSGRSTGAHVHFEVQGGANPFQ